MKLDVTQVLKQRNGEALKDKAEVVKDGKITAEVINAVLRTALINALEATLDVDRNEQPIKKYERGKLADKIYENDEVELSAEEVTLIKERVGKAFQTYVVKVVWDLLEVK